MSEKPVEITEYADELISVRRAQGCCWSLEQVESMG